MTKSLTFDAARLVALARTRDRNRALVRSENDRYQIARESLLDLRRQLGAARDRAIDTRDPAASDAQIARLESRVEEIRAEMAGVQIELDAFAEAAGDAGRLLTACLQFAKEHGLDLPSALRAEAVGAAA